MRRVGVLREEVSWGHAEGLGDLDDDVERRVAAALLDAPVVRAVDTRLVREALLGPALRLSQCADARAEGVAVRKIGHLSTFAAMLTINHCA